MRRDVEGSLKKFNIKTFGSKKLIENAERNLNENETVHYITPANVVITDINSNESSKQPGIFILTDSRFMFYQKLGAHEALDTVGLDKVESTNCIGNSLKGGKIEFCTLAKTYDVPVTYKKEIMKSIQETVRNCMDSYNRQSTTNQSVAVSSSADEILKFKNLLDSGVITEDEFNAKKTELLGL